MGEPLVKGATFKKESPCHRGAELNPKCSRYLCPYETDENGQGACVSSPCPYAWKGVNDAS
jgi:hypothetical protein